MTVLRKIGAGAFSLLTMGLYVVAMAAMFGLIAWLLK
jgi:hypothetical protein